MSAETIELLVSQEALRALGIGAVVVVVVAAAGAWWKQSHEVALPGAGIALVVAFLVAVPAGMRPTTLAIVGMLAAAGGAFLSRDRLLQGLLAVPGAFLVAFSLPVEVGLGLRVLVGVVVPVGGALVAEFDDRYRDRALGTALFAISTVGVFFALPDTEHALILLMVSAPFVFLSWPKGLAALGAPGAFAAVALMMWVISVDAFARPMTAIGASATLGILVVEPIVARLIGPEQPSLHSNLIVVWGAQLAVVYVASRIAAPRQPLAVAVIVTALSLVVAGGVSYALSRPELDPARERSRGR